MNTVGKILVFLNFLFAVVVGMFLVVDFATRTNWKTEYDNLKRQTEVISADRATYFEGAASGVNKQKDLELQIERAKGDLEDQKTQANVREVELKNQVETAQKKAKDADLNLAKAVTDVERLKVVESDLRGVIKDREKSINSQADDVKTYRTQALSNDQLAKQLAQRLQELLVQLQDVTQKYNVAIARGPGAGMADSKIPQSGYESNPPASQVKGKIDKVDGNLVQLSVGTDNGVNKYNTMEAFRTSPNAKYLGMIRIVEAYPHRSVGQLVVRPGVTVRPQLKAGDQVWSWLK